MESRFRQNGWLWAGLLLTLFKLWLTRGQAIFAIGPAIHDDRLFLELAGRILNGEWLGPYNPLTLAKGPGFPLFVALVFLTGVPLGLAQQALYAAACAAVTRALRPWLRSGAVLLAVYALLLWNPMSYEGHNLTRILRQNLYTPLALLVFAGLIGLGARRDLPVRRQAPWAALGGLAFGGFWLTREESVWILPSVTVLAAVWLAAIRQDFAGRLRPMALTAGVAVLAAALPLLSVSWMNYRHYGWFGTVEFHGGDFEDAYGALLRLRVGPELPMVPVTRQMREAAYAVSPTFAELRPQLEGPVGDKWADKANFPAAERQIGGGWFMWALRDAVAAAGRAHSAGEAMAFYRRMADEINRAADAGRIAAGPPRRGFLPPMQADMRARLWPTLVEFHRYVASFSSFTAQVAPSIGDEQDVRLFRDLTHDELSPGERLTPRPAPEAAWWRQRRVDWLEAIGDRVCRLLSWLLPVAEFIALARLLECAAKRRAPPLLAVAVAAGIGAAAYVVVNVLVHVTSFPNLTPAALSSAYPLAILFVLAVFSDAAVAWLGRTPPASRSAADSAPALTPTRRRVADLLWAAGAAGIVLAARLAEIRAHAGDVPFNDQWKIEAADILGPWVNGTLNPLAFFAPHFEHVPVWTRLLAWLEVAVTGRWDPLVQMTVNAMWYAAFVAGLLRWARSALGVAGAAGVTLVAIACGALPHAWENMAWGFQSQFPLALLCLFLHARGSFAHAPGSRGWWWAQAWGLAGLFTLASMWLAPLAVAGASFWARRKGPGRRFAPLAISALGLAIIAVIHATAPPGGSFARPAGSALQFLNAWLDLIAWPGGWAGAVVVLNAPLLAFALRLRRREDASAFDLTVLALGLWAIGQAAALAFARGGDYTGYVSRYGELLVAGVLANAIALVRLAGAGRGGGPWFALLGAGWVATLAGGLAAVSFSGHAGYFHQHSAEWARMRRDAVQAYLERHDRTLLEAPGTRAVLYQDVDQVTRLLDEPRFRALLPASVNPASRPDPAGRGVRALQDSWNVVLVLAGLTLAAGAAAGWRGRGELAELESRPDGRGDWIVGGTGAVAAVLVGLWPSPFTFDQEIRWRELLWPPAVVRDMSFEFVGPAPYPNSRLVGAAAILPENLRNYFFGTKPAGPELIGVVRSTPFKLGAPFLVVPLAGFPSSAGNELRLEVDDPAGGAPVVLKYSGPNPADIGFWTVDVSAHQGRSARIVLVDNRPADEGWVAASAPIATADAGLAESLARRLRLERLAAAHAALAWLALAGLGWWAIARLATWLRGSS